MMEEGLSQHESLPVAEEDALLKKAVVFEAERRFVDAIACYSLLVLFHDDRASVQVEHFQQRLAALISEEFLPTPQWRASNVKAALVLLGENVDAGGDTVAEGDVQVFDDGTRKLVVVASLGFCSGLLVPETFPGNRFVFKPSGFAVVFPEGEAASAGAAAEFPALFKEPVVAVVLGESARVLREMSQSVSAAILAGASMLSAQIAPAQTHSVEVAPPALRRVEETSLLARSASGVVGEKAKQAGRSAVAVAQHAMAGAASSSATTVAALDFLAAGATGLLAVTSAAWSGAGLALRATGEAAAAVRDDSLFFVCVKCVCQQAIFPGDR